MRIKTHILTTGFVVEKSLKKEKKKLILSTPSLFLIDQHLHIVIIIIKLLE